MIEPVPADFKCMQCGNCCTITGSVGVSAAEVESIAGYMGMQVEEFTDRYTVLSENRMGLKLKDHEDGSCIFLREDRACEINPAKPQQCRTFPWEWNYRDWTKVCSFHYKSRPEER